MEELAKASGISRPTLSKYFEDPRSVRVSTRQRIEAALELSDYQPNVYARNLNRKRTRNIGILVPHMTDPFYAALVARLERQCAAEGYWPIVISSHGSPESEERAMALLQSAKAAGLILAPLGHGRLGEIVAGLRGDIPIVYCDVAADDEHPVVRTDNVQSIDVMVDYLCRTGAPPAYFEVPDVNSNSRERRAAYIDAMERFGEEPRFIGAVRLNDWDLEESAYEAMLAALDASSLPYQTILCNNDRTAMGVLAAAFKRRVSVGRRKGNTLRIAGHDDQPLARYTCPPLTTMAQDLDGMAERSVSMLLGMIGDEHPDRIRQPVGNVILPAQLIMRQSA